jgi:hypothetical protein
VDWAGATIRMLGALGRRLLADRKFLRPEVSGIRPLVRCRFLEVRLDVEIKSHMFWPGWL